MHSTVPPCALAAFADTQCKKLVSDILVRRVQGLGFSAPLKDGAAEVKDGSDVPPPSEVMEHQGLLQIGD